MQNENANESAALTPRERTASHTIERAETRPELHRLAPAVDIFENEEELLLVFDLPGVSEEAIELRVERGDLSLTAEHPARQRVFRRAFTLPDTVDPEKVEAELRNGVLQVHLGFRDDLKPRRIEVRSV